MANEPGLTPARVFEVPKGSSVAVHSSLNVTDPELVKAMADRLPGVGLLAEVSTTKHSVAQYRELIRFLEHAFARSLNKLEKKLSQFLISGDLGYTRNEVKDWIRPGHGAIHRGDRQEREDSSWRGTSGDSCLAWSRPHTMCCSTKLSGTIRREHGDRRSPTTPRPQSRCN